MVVRGGLKLRKKRTTRKDKEEKEGKEVMVMVGEEDSLVRMARETIELVDAVEDKGQRFTSAKQDRIDEKAKVGERMKRVELNRWEN